MVHTEDAEVENKFQQTSRFKLEDISHFAENVGRCLLTGSLFHFLFFQFMKRDKERDCGRCLHEQTNFFKVEW